MALPATDTFTTGADAALSTYSANWSMNTGAIQVLAASDDFHANTSANEVGAFHNVETYNNDQYSQITISAISDSSIVGAAVRCGSAGVASYYGFYEMDSSDYLFKMVTGTFTQLGSTGSGGAVSDTIRIEASSTTITPKRNGSTPGTPGAQTDSSLSSGKAGICGYGNSNLSRGDNFEGGNLTATENLPQFIAAGAQTVTNTSGATLSPALHAGWAVGDAMLMIIAGRCNGSTITNTFSNTWDLLGSQFLEIGAGNTDLWIGVYGRYAQVGEAAPTVTPDADFLPGSTTGGVSAQIAGFRYTTLVEDVTEGTNTSGAAATWTPPSVTTVTNNVMVVTCVATNDDNALNFNTANSFSLAMSGASYDTTTGSDHAVGMGYLLKTALGAVTMPIWNQSAVGTDSWVGVTVALRPGIAWWIMDPPVYDNVGMFQALKRSTFI